MPLGDFVNPDIIMGYKSPDFSALDPSKIAANALAYRRAQTEQQTNALALQQKQQEMQQEEGLRNYLAKKPDLTSPDVQQQLVSQFGQAGINAVSAHQQLLNQQRQGQIYQQQYDENKHKEVQRAIQDIEKYSDKASAWQGIEKSFEEGKLDQQSYDYLQNLMHSNPSWTTIKGQILTNLGTAEQQLAAAKPNWEKRSNNAEEWLVDTNPTSSTYGQEQKGSRVTLGLTPYEKEQQRQFNITEARLAKAAEDKTAAADITTSPATAKIFLSNIGYDVNTGTDNISGLILGSTSGGLEEAGAGAYEWLTGESTKGMAKISQLQQAAAKVTLDLMPGGKLSAGISNEDRRMIQQLNGDIGNPKLSDTRRLAAWRQLVDFMKTKAGYTSAPTPGGAGMGAGAQTYSMSSNPAVEALVKQYATPTNTGKK